MYYLLLYTASSPESVASSVDVPQDVPLFLRPVTPSDSYSVRVKVHDEGEDCAAVRVVEGVCSVNGVQCDPGEARQQLRNGEIQENNDRFLCGVDVVHSYCIHCYYTV